ncbi:unnamed protein product [Musa hybrid cultivar]
MMDSSRLLKKPKLEDEPIELIEGDNEGKPSNYNKSRDDNVSMQEQEEALVALIEHRTKECQLLKQKLAHYKSQLEEAEKRLSESQAKLDRIRLRSKAAPVATDAVKTEARPSNPIRNNNDHAQTRPTPSQQLSRPQLLIPPHNTRLPSLAADARAGRNAKPELKASAAAGGPMDSSPSTQPAGTGASKPFIEKGGPVGSKEKRIKRKLEQKEHQDLIHNIRSSSSPCIIRFQSGTLISSQHKRKLRSLELCPVNDHLFVTSALDGVVNLWQVQAKGSNASLLSSMDCLSPKQRRWPEDIAWHPDGDRIFAAYTADGGDSQISVLNLNASREKKVTFLEGKPHQKGIINSIMFMPWIDLCFVTGGSDHAVILWQEIDDSWKPKTIHGNLHSSAVMGVAGLQQKKTVLSVGADKRIIAFDMLSGRSEFKNQIESKCMSVLPNPFDALFAFLREPGRQLRLFDVRLRQTEIHAFGWKQETSESQSALINQAWSPDGLYITSGSADPMIHIFDIRYDGRKPSQSVQAHQKRVFKAIGILTLVIEWRRWDVVGWALDDELKKIGSRVTVPTRTKTPSETAHYLLRLGGLATTTATMPGIHVPAAAAASIFSPAYSFSFDDDDGFGDFKFASSVQPFPSHPPPPPTQQQQHQQDDYDWGDFVVSPIGSHPVESPSPPPLFDAFPPLYAAASDKIAGVKQWEKPSGALPLSIFGEEEVDEPEPLHPPVLFSASLSSSIPARDRKGPVAAHGELRDLITSLYGQASQPVGGDNDGLCLAEGKEDDSDESSWEYKDASSSSPNSVLKEDGIRNEKSGLQCTETADFREIEVRIGSLFTWPLFFFSCILATLFSEIRCENLQLIHLAPPCFLLKHCSSLSKAMKNQNIQDAESNVSGPNNHSDFLHVKKSTGFLPYMDFSLGSFILISIWLNLDDWPIHSHSSVKEESDVSPYHDKNGYFYEPTSVGSATKDIISGPSAGLSNNILDLFIEVDQEDAIYSEKDATKKGQNSDMDPACEINKYHSTNLSYNTPVDLYHRLKDGSIFLLNCHLDNLEKAYGVASLSGEQIIEMKRKEEIKAVYKKLEEAKGTRNIIRGEHLPVDVYVSQLLKAVEEPNFRAFEQEYHLSERILSAGKEASAAIELLEHTTSVLHILALASREEQRAYIDVWSNMAVACVQELQHGAKVLKESVQAQTLMQILFGEAKYFIALGEIYRVTEVLRASMKRYKPWILLNCGGLSKLSTSLDKCAEAWTISGLEESLKNFSNANDAEYAGLAKALLASIKIIRDLDLSHYSCNHNRRICKLSLFSMEELQDMKMGLWCGEYYFVKLANLWANRISCDPPQLPCLHV